MPKRLFLYVNIVFLQAVCSKKHDLLIGKFHVLYFMIGLSLWLKMRVEKTGMKAGYANST